MRRPGPFGSRGVVVSVAAALALAGCGGPIGVEGPALSPAESQTCAELVDALPDTLAGEERREVEPTDRGAAWGDPALVLTCGVERPGDWQPDAECTDIGGIGWFVPLDELSDPSVEVTATALTHTPYVSLQVPPQYRSEGIDAALAELAAPLAEHLTTGEPCV